MHFCFLISWVSPLPRLQNSLARWPGSRLRAKEGRNTVSYELGPASRRRHHRANPQTTQGAEAQHLKEGTERRNCDTPVVTGSEIHNGEDCVETGEAVSSGGSLWLTCSHLGCSGCRELSHKWGPGYNPQGVITHLVTHFCQLWLPSRGSVTSQQSIIR